MIRTSHLPNIAGTPLCEALRPVRKWECRSGVGLMSHRSARGTRNLAVPGNFTGRRALCTLNSFSDGVPCGSDSYRGEARYDFATTMAGLSPRHRVACARQLRCLGRRSAVAFLFVCRDRGRGRFVDAASVQRSSLWLRFGRAMLEILLLFQHCREARVGSPQRHHASVVRRCRTGAATDRQSITGPQELLFGTTGSCEVVLLRECRSFDDGRSCAGQATPLDFVFGRRSLPRRRSSRMAQCSRKPADQGLRRLRSSSGAGSGLRADCRIDSDFGFSIDGGTAASNRLESELSRFHFSGSPSALRRPGMRSSRLLRSVLCGLASRVTFERSMSFRAPFLGNS